MSLLLNSSLHALKNPVVPASRLCVEVRAFDPPDESGPRLRIANGLAVGLWLLPRAPKPGSSQNPPFADIHSAVRPARAEPASPGVRRPSPRTGRPRLPRRQGSDDASLKNDATGALVPDIRGGRHHLRPQSGQILWSENAQDKRSISITKVMTAVVFLEDQPDSPSYRRAATPTPHRPRISAPTIASPSTTSST